MKTFAYIACILLVSQGLAFAGDKPQTFTGTIGKPDARLEQVGSKLGRNGVLFIRTAARWDELNKLMSELEPDKPLPDLDFTKQAAILIYAADRRGTDAFSLGDTDLTANPPELNFMLTWDNSAEEQRESRYAKFILAVIPATPEVKVVLTSSPMQANRNHPVTEFSAVLGGKDGGDVAGGLQATITPKADTIKPGEDILIDFTLHMADPGDAKPLLFIVPKSIFVWDGKYSNGYRNHAFLVTTPDGKTAFLRPKEIDKWEKNIPHPVEITAKEPYQLPSWAEGDTHKSLKELGLDTSAPGTYTIVGLYEEATAKRGDPDADRKPLWGGSISSNTITVEVK